MVLMTSRLISARISVERMLCSSRLSIQTVDCLEVWAVQGVYCFQSTALAVTVTFSIENAISLKVSIRQDFQRHLYAYPDLRVGASIDTRGWVQSGRVRTRLADCTHTNVTSGESVGSVKVVLGENAVSAVEQELGSA